MSRTLHILMTEDNPDHALLTELALRDAEVAAVCQVQVDAVHDGETCLRYLRREAEFAAAVRPDLLLLDINMPGLSGLDVLTAVKADRALATIPVIMLTTSARDQDVLASYRLGANEYVTKPVTAQEFRSKVQAIPAYWSTVATRPPRDRA